jgi:hypothetical protein
MDGQIGEEAVLWRLYNGWSYGVLAMFLKNEAIYEWNDWWRVDGLDE